MTLIESARNASQLDDLYRTDPDAFYRVIEKQSAEKAEAEARESSAERRRRTRVLLRKFAVNAR
jgi:hypothetical protein